MKNLDRYILEKFQITKDSKIDLSVDIMGKTSFTKQELDDILSYCKMLPTKIYAITNVKYAGNGPSVMSSNKILIYLVPKTSLSKSYIEVVEFHDAKDFEYAVGIVLKGRIYPRDLARNMNELYDYIDQCIARYESNK